MTQLAIGYGRDRSHRQDDCAPSPDEQRIACEKYAAAHGLELIEFHFDEAGGDACVPRPGLSHTLDALARDGVTALVINELTTLGRDGEDILQTLHFLFHHAVELHTVAEGRFVCGLSGTIDRRGLVVGSALGGDPVTDRAVGYERESADVSDGVASCVDLRRAAQEKRASVSGFDDDDCRASAKTKASRPEKAVPFAESSLADLDHETRTAICYIRDRPRSPHKKKLTLEEQRRSCLEYAAKRGLHVTTFHSDELGAKSERPGFEKTLRALGRDGHKALLIYDIASLGGDHDTECGLMDLLIEHDVEFHTVVEGWMRGFGYGSCDMTDPSAWPAGVTSEILA